MSDIARPMIRPIWWLVPPMKLNSDSTHSSFPSSVHMAAQNFFGAMMCHKVLPWHAERGRERERERERERAV